MCHLSFLEKNQNSKSFFFVLSNPKGDEGCSLNPEDWVTGERAALGLGERGVAAVGSGFPGKELDQSFGNG